MVDKKNEPNIELIPKSEQTPSPVELRQEAESALKELVSSLESPDTEPFSGYKEDIAKMNIDSILKAFSQRMEAIESGELSGDELDKQVEELAREEMLLKSRLDLVSGLTKNNELIDGVFALSDEDKIQLLEASHISDNDFNDMAIFYTDISSVANLSAENVKKYSQVINKIKFGQEIIDQRDEQSKEAEKKQADWKFTGDLLGGLAMEKGQNWYNRKGEGAMTEEEHLFMIDMLSKKEPSKLTPDESSSFFEIVKKLKENDQLDISDFANEDGTFPGPN